MKFRSAVLGLLLNTLSMSVMAGFLDGSKLFGYLEQSVNGSVDYLAGVGSGYVVGVTDSLQGISFCPPTGENAVSVKQIERVVYNFMKAHPEKWNLSASIAVKEALSSAWPCR